MVGWLAACVFQNRVLECDNHVGILNGPSEIRQNFRSYFSSVPNEYHSEVNDEMMLLHPTLIH